MPQETTCNPVPVQECLQVYCCCHLVARLCLTLLEPHGLQLARLLCPWDFQGTNIGMGLHFLFQELFLTQGSNLCLLHWQVGSSPLSYQGSPPHLLPSNKLLFQIFCGSTQFSSVAQSCLTLQPMDYSMSGFPDHYQLPELAQTHVHRVGDAIQLSHPLLSPNPLVFNLSYHQGLFQGVSFLHQVDKVLEFQLQHQSL